MEYVTELTAFFEKHARPKVAVPMKAYMRNRFEFLGLQSQSRKKLSRGFYNKYGRPAPDDVDSIIRQIWNLPWRELHYVGQELAGKYTRYNTPDTLQLYQFMITTDSWWDTVDFIAAHLVGRQLQKFPDQKEIMDKKWAVSDNMWLRRSSILFQLKYKENTDIALLQSIIEKNLGSDEFFINKAIGWALREYSKTDAEWVLKLVETLPLHSLSGKEALKWLNNHPKV